MNMTSSGSAPSATSCATSSPTISICSLSADMSLAITGSAADQPSDGVRARTVRSLLPSTELIASETLNTARGTLAATAEPQLSFIVATQ